METQTKYESAPKDTVGKPRFSLLPWCSIRKIISVYEFGTKEYYENSWRKGFTYSSIWDATMRHLTDWWEGQEVDPKSGLHPLLHAGFNILTLIYLADEFKHLDNRPRNGVIPF